MIHKHDINTAISDLRQALDHVEHYSGRPEVFCLKQLLVNPLAYLLSEVIIRADQGESPGTDVQQAKHETDKPDLCEGMPHGSCKGETWCNKSKVCFRPA